MYRIKLYLLLLPLVISAYPLDRRDMFIGKTEQDDPKVTSDKQIPNKLMIEGAVDNSLCKSPLNCIQVQKYWISKENTFSCFEDTIFISFETNVDDKIFISHGYITPYTSENSIVTSKKFSKKCRLIKRLFIYLFFIMIR